MQMRLERNEGFFLCTHCEGEGYCRVDGERGGCQFCVEEQSAARLESNPDDPSIQVTCGACGGKGYFGTPPHMVRDSEPDRRPSLSVFRLVISFVVVVIVAMVSSAFIVWSVQASPKSSMQYGTLDEAMRFDSYITMHENRRMTVEEIVILKSYQRKEFFVERVYPALKASFLKRNRPDIRLKEVYIDGEPLKFKLSIRGKALIIRSFGKIITPGVHTYAFIYDMPLPVIERRGKSTFKWVVSGSSWGFPAKQTTLAIVLSPKVNQESVEITGGVGPSFWFKRECISTVDDSGHIAFNAGQPMTKLDRLVVEVLW